VSAVTNVYKTKIIKAFQEACVYLQKNPNRILRNSKIFYLGFKIDSLKAKNKNEVELE
jgi:hypothetical protein